ncbi:MAG: hypothetical protein HUK20_11475 [Fibrobacter sp.]|nr:hypothetical protein [Fibrobacter sp.]
MGKHFIPFAILACASLCLAEQVSCPKLLQIEQNTSKYCETEGHSKCKNLLKEIQDAISNSCASPDMNSIAEVPDTTLSQINSLSIEGKDSQDIIKEIQSTTISESPKAPKKAAPKANRKKEAVRSWIFREKHDGFFYNMLFGAGYAIAESNGDKNLEMEKEADFKIGYSVIENLAIHATFMTGYSYIEPRKSEFTDRVWHFIGGLGATYYFMPRNIYVSGSLGYDFDLDETDGIGGAIQVGKEWKVSDYWGIGLALSYLFSFRSDDRNDYMDHNLNFALTFTHN